MALQVGLDFLTCGSADSGVGAGIDSYYEYLMKAYILLGDDVFLQRFNTVSPPLLRLVRLQVLPACHQSHTSACVCVCWTTALQRHHEVHQSAAAAAQRAHAQPHCERAQLDGFPAGLLPRLAGQEFFTPEFYLQPAVGICQRCDVFFFFPGRFCEET